PRAGGGGARRQPGARAHERGGPEPALVLLAGGIALRPQHRPGWALLRARPSRHAGRLERGGAADRPGHHGRAALPGAALPAAALPAAAALRPGRPLPLEPPRRGAARRPPQAQAAVPEREVLLDPQRGLLRRLVRPGALVRLAVATPGRVRRPGAHPAYAAG